MRKRVPLLWLLILTLALSGCAMLPKEEALLAPPLVELQQSALYDTALVARGDIAEVASVGGVLASSREEALFFAQDGLRLEAFHVQPGDVVPPGALVASALSDDLPLQIEIQKNRVEMARLEAESLTGTPREIALLQWENEKLSLKALEEKRAQTLLYTERGGLVLFINAQDQGAEIPAFTVMARLVDPTALAAYAQSASLRAVTPGMRVTVTMGGVDYEGEIIQAPQAALTTDARLRDAALARVDGLPEGAKMGDTLTLRAVLRESRDALLIPRGALRTVASSAYVQVLENGVRKEYAVTTGIMTGAQVEILSGLTEGMEVILP